jgi:cyclopentanol dehydrogenase
MGAAEAKLFATEGAKVAIGDILEREGKRVEAEINETGGEAMFVRLDVTMESEWRSAIAATVRRFGKLDVLVNNAGVAVRGKVEETSEEQWNRAMDINAKGVFLGTKVAIFEMRRAGGGSIVNISSVAGIVGSPVLSAYNASKGAVRLLTKATAIQYAKDGIRCNSVHPGPIATPMNEYQRADPKLLESNLSRVPMARYGQPEEVAYGVLYLASDESSYVTGSELVIDGGLTAQ